MKYILLFVCFIALSVYIVSAMSIFEEALDDVLAEQLASSTATRCYASGCLSLRKSPGLYKEPLASVCNVWVESLSDSISYTQESWNHYVGWRLVRYNDIEGYLPVPNISCK